jgi:hypothetical protein
MEGCSGYAVSFRMQFVALQSGHMGEDASNNVVNCIHWNQALNDVQML